MASRRSNKRKRRDRGRFGSLYKLLSLIIILVVVAAGSAVFFRVEEITVEGEGRYTADEIIAASGVEQGDDLFLIDRAGTAQKIYTALPYVESVSIHRSLPDGLVIQGSAQLPGGEVSGYNDHRIVMAMAIAAARCRAGVTVSDAEAVGKSYPGFWEAYQQLGGICHVL